MASNPSPSSSSDVSIALLILSTKKFLFDILLFQVDEDESEYPPSSKKFRTSPEESALNSDTSSRFLSSSIPTISSCSCLDMSVNSNSCSSHGCHDEPSSSQATECTTGLDNVDHGDPAPLLASLQARLREREVELNQHRQEAESFLKELQESVECPVCFSIPRAPPVPCCQNGHVICSKCKDKVEVRYIKIWGKLKIN